MFKSYTTKIAAVAAAKSFGLTKASVVEQYGAWGFEDSEVAANKGLANTSTKAHNASSKQPKKSADAGANPKGKTMSTKPQISGAAAAATAAAAHKHAETKPETAAEKAKRLKAEADAAKVKAKTEAEAKAKEAKAASEKAKTEKAEADAKAKKEKATAKEAADKAKAEADKAKATTKANEEAKKAAEKAEAAAKRTKEQAEKYAAQDAAYNDKRKERIEASKKIVEAAQAKLDSLLKGEGEMRNGWRKPGADSKCGRVWAHIESMSKAAKVKCIDKEAFMKHMETLAYDDIGTVSNASSEYHNYRRFHGITG